MPGQGVPLLESAGGEDMAQALLGLQQEAADKVKEMRAVERATGPQALTMSLIRGPLHKRSADHH